MKKWLPFVIVMVLVVSGLGFGAYSWLKPKPVPGPEVKIDQHYQIKSMRNGLFRYPHAVTGMPTSEIIGLKTNDASYCAFENNFKNFRITFEHGAKRTEMLFVVTHIKRNKASLNATIRHLYDGDIREYKVYTTEDRIIFTSTVNYKVTVSSDEHAAPPVEELYRENTVVMSFLREVQS
ncbi:MAG: hypothetical protein LBG88_01600 [Christensenellaceae bacterium]|jgi:hypothetical protein|nr:hypothetical protein [Christensenellaceae bacterium]